MVFVIVVHAVIIVFFLAIEAWLNVGLLLFCRGVVGLGFRLSLSRWIVLLLILQRHHDGLSKLRISVGVDAEVPELLSERIVRISRGATRLSHSTAAHGTCIG